jgi:hypothetical protein
MKADIVGSSIDARYVSKADAAREDTANNQSQDVLSASRFRLGEYQWMNAPASSQRRRNSQASPSVLNRFTRPFSYATWPRQNA